MATSLLVSNLLQMTSGPTRSLCILKYQNFNIWGCQQQKIKFIFRGGNTGLKCIMNILNNTVCWCRYPWK